MNRCAVALGLAACLWSCGDNKPASPTVDARPDAATLLDASHDAPAATSVTSFCSALSATICAGLQACECRFDQRPYDASGCVTARTNDCIMSFGDNVGPDLATGRAAFDEHAVQACLNDTSALANDCDLNQGLGSPLPTACSSVVRATAAVGENCTLRGSGLAFCGAGGEGVCVPNESAPTRCVALPTANEACFNDLCAPGLVCNAGTCREPAMLGAACVASPVANPCGLGLVCDASNHCSAPLAVGATCDSTAQCQAGLTCTNAQCTVVALLGDGCTGPNTCGSARGCGRAPETRTCSTPDNVGDACLTDTCATGLVCPVDMTCTVLPGPGNACLDGTYCAAGATCLDGVGTCAVLPGINQTCAAGSRFCADGLGCRFSDNTCQPGPAAGQECLLNPPDYVCAAGLGCDFGSSGSICKPLTGAGAACNTDRTCNAVTYCDGNTQTCVARHGNGARCEQPNECTGGLECAFAPGGSRCRPIPSNAQPCESACTAGLACKGPGGECVKAFCTLP